MSSGPNKELIRELLVLLDEAKLGSDPNDRFRAKSYKSAIDKISFPLKTLKSICVIFLIS